MKPASPDPSQPPAQPTPESWALRADWRQEPPSLAREEAGRALEALGRAAGEAAGATAPHDVPPVPDDLRSRWTGAYGRPGQPADRWQPAPAPAEDARSPSFSRWLASLFHQRRVAWVGGGAAAVAALAMMLSKHAGGGPQVALAEPGRVLRGQTATAGGEPVPIVLVAASAATAATDEVRDVVRQVFPGREVRVVATAHEAAAAAQSQPRLVVVNLGSGLVTAWAGGKLAEEFPPSDAPARARFINQIESADESLEKSAAAP